MDINSFLDKSKKIISKRIRKHRLRSFYISHIKEGKNLIARELDRLLLSFIVFISIAIFLIFQFQVLYLSIVIGLILAVLFYIGIRIKDFKELESSKEAVKESIVIDKLYNELLNKSPEEFEDYFVDLFSDLDFKDVSKSNKKEFNIEVKRNSIKTGIKTLQYTRGYDVDEETVREFFLDLRRYNFDEGILITTTDFTQEANNLIKKIEKHMKLHLVEMKDIVHILHDTSMYPKEKDIEVYILNKITKERKRIFEYSNNIISSSKWKKYLISGFILWLFGQFTDFYIYYLIVSIILFSLGIVSLIKKIINSIYGYKNKEDNKFIYDFIYKE